MYSNGAICLIKLLFKMGLFTVHTCPGAAQAVMERQVQGAARTETSRG
jgi:hypothetical protein